MAALRIEIMNGVLDAEFGVAKGVREIFATRPITHRPEIIQIRRAHISIVDITVIIIFK
jgi:hypothetical protein